MIVSVGCESQKSEPSVGINSWLAWAAEYEAHGSVDTAARCYESVLGVNPGNDIALQALGRIEFRRANYRVSAGCFERAIETRPDAPLSNDAGCAYLKLSEYANAEPHFRNAIDLDPTNQRYANNLATLLVDCGDDEQAVAVLERVHVPAAVQYNMAHLYAQRQRLDLARTHLDASLRLDPRLAPALRLAKKLAE